MNRTGPKGRSKTHCACMETLDQRLLLSTTLDNGVLTIMGTDQPDRISVAASPFANALVVDDDGEAHYFALSAITQINIDGLGGNDRLRVGGSLAPMKYNVSVNGGAGSDRIWAYGGHVTVIGGSGRDRILAVASVASTVGGGGGNDLIRTGSAKDDINSGSGNDFVSAGSGNDTVTDSGGRDTIIAGAGNDTVRALGHATINGGDGNDLLIGTFVYGGNGNDTIYGTSAGDYLRGEGGDDLIFGYGGRDSILGDSGDDALFGGSDSDTLLGGAGNDNLYGGDGYTDKNTADDGHDIGLGGDGADWWDPVHIWRKVDANKTDNPAQNRLSQDPSLDHYQNNAGIHVLGDNDAIITGDDYRVIDANLGLGVGNPSSSVSVHPATNGFGNISLGPAGWLSTGKWDASSQTFVPPVLSSSDAASAKVEIVQLPANWQVGSMTHGSDGLAWYPVSAPFTAHLSGKLFVSTTDGGTAQLTPSTPGAVSGIDPRSEAGYSVWLGGSSYAIPAGKNLVTDRFIGLRPGSVIITRSSRTSHILQWPLDTPLLPLATHGDVWLAGGGGTMHHLVPEFSNIPKLSEGAHAILVDDGAIILSADGGHYLSA